MREILENSIDFSKLEGYSKDDIKFEMKRAVLSRETGVLELRQSSISCCHMRP